MNSEYNLVEEIRNQLRPLIDGRKIKPTANKFGLDVSTLWRAANFPETIRMPFFNKLIKFGLFKAPELTASETEQMFSELLDKLDYLQNEIGMQTSECFDRWQDIYALVGKSKKHMLTISK